MHIIKVMNLTVCDSTGFNKLCLLDQTKLGSTVNSLINFIFVIAILIALLYLVYGGIKWITSGGDKTAVESARNHITSALIGLVIVFLSYFVLNIVLGFFLGNSLSGIELPHL